MIISSYFLFQCDSCGKTIEIYGKSEPDINIINRLTDSGWAFIKHEDKLCEQFCPDCK